MRGNHRYVALFLILTLLLIGAASCGTATHSQVTAPTSSLTQGVTTQLFKRVTPEKALEIIRAHKGDPHFVILDVRTPQEYNAGHLAGAINVDFYSPNFKQQLSKLDRTKTYVLYCHSGNRSGRTVPIMKKLGFKRVYEIEGGIANWLSQGLPLTP